MMSSDSSCPSKMNGERKIKPGSKTRNLSSSEESDDRQISHGSGESQKSIIQPKVTVLEQLSFKSLPVMESHQKEVPLKGTSSTHNSTAAPTVITAVLRDLQDDIVRSPEYRQPGPVALVNTERSIAVIGGDNIYVQSKTKFIPVPREKALATEHDQNFWAYQSSKLEDYSPLDVAVLVQKVFIPISSMCFGLLGGVALLQLILVHHLIGGTTDQDQYLFLQSYSRFAELTPILFYVLLAVCIVSVLDRIPTHDEVITCQPSWLVLAVYSLTLVLTLSCASYDDMITLYPHNKTLFQDQRKTQEVLSEWQWLNTLRCVCAILGWILLSLTTPLDLLLQHLLDIKQYEQNKQNRLSPASNSLPQANNF